MVHHLLLLFLLSADADLTYGISSPDQEQSINNLERLEVPWITQILTMKMMSYVPTGEGNGDTKCTLHGAIYESHLRNLTFWATRMFDARATGVNSGLLHGNNFNMGHFDECVSISVPSLGIRGKYVAAMLEFLPDDDVYSNFLKAPSNVYKDPPDTASTWEALKPTTDLRMRKRNVIKWAVCVPDSCTEKDVEASLRNHIYPTLMSHDMRGTINVMQEYTYSRKATKSDPSPGYLVFLNIVKGLLALVVSSTIIDIIFTAKKDKAWYMHFSLKAHAPQLFSMEQSSFPNISGIKTFNVFLTIFGHRMMLTQSTPLFNSKENELWIGELGSIITLNGIVMVNTFMVITGFLTFYKFINMEKEGKNINVWESILQRWLRLVPTYAFVLAFQYFTFPQYEGGPMSRGVLFDPTVCGKYWWTHLLLLNNYVSVENQCLVPAWYLSVDFHLYILLVFLGHFYIKRRKLGIYMIAAFTFLAVIIPGIYVMVYHYNGISLMYPRIFAEDHNDKQFVTMYMYSHTRAAPHFMGVIGAFIYDRVKKITPPSKIYYWILTVITTGLLLSTLFGSYFFYIPGRPYVLWENIAYAVLHRVVWSIGILIIIIGGTIGEFGPLKYTIGARVLEPFNKLTYCAILIHTPIQVFLSGFIRTPVYYSNLYVIWMAMADICSTYIISIILYCLVEAPFSALSTKYFKVNKKPKK